VWKKETKISKRYARIMEFHKEFGGAAKEGGGAWTYPCTYYISLPLPKTPCRSPPHQDPSVPQCNVSSFRGEYKIFNFGQPLYLKNNN
jgi:hypothetical protein